MAAVTAICVTTDKPYISFDFSFSKIFQSLDYNYKKNIQSNIECPFRDVPYFEVVLPVCPILAPAKPLADKGSTAL